MTEPPKNQFLNPRFWDWIAGGILVVQLSSLYTLGAGLLQCPIVLITAVCFAILLGYSAMNWPQLRQILRCRYLIAWFLFLLVLPLLQSVLGTVYDPRQALRYAFYFVLMLSAGILYRRRGLPAVGMLLTAGLLITAAGILLSLFGAQMDLFERIFTVTDRENTFQGRAFGFALQPNEQARDLTFLFLVWLPFLSGPGRRRQTAAFFAFGILILLTGSRAGFLLAGMLFGLYCLKTYCRVQGGRIWIDRRPVLAVCLAVLCAVCAGPLLIEAADTLLPEYYGSYGLLERIDSLLQANLMDTSQKGTSTVRDRLDRNTEFAVRITERPLSGHGLGTHEIFRIQGRIPFSSHNQYLMIAFERGIPMVLFYLALNLLLIRDPRRREAEQPLGTAVYLPFVLAVLVAGLFSNTLLDSRTYYIASGFLIALLSKPANPSDPIVQPGSPQ